MIQSIRWLSACLVVLWVASAHAREGLPPTIEDALERGDHATAIPLLEAHLAKNKGDGAAWVALADMLAMKKDFKAASAALKNVVADPPRDRHATLLCGYVSTRYVFDDITASFLRRNPDDPDLLFMHAMTALHHGEARDRHAAITRGDLRTGSGLRYAALALERLYVINPNYPQIHRWLGFACTFDESHLPRAAEMLRKAVQAPDAGWEDYALLASVLTRGGRLAEAEPCWQKARDRADHHASHRRDSHRATVEFMRARALRKADRPNAAIEACRAVIALQTDFAHIRHELGLAAFDAGNYPLAAWAFSESISFQAHPNDLYLLGRTAYAMGNDAWAESLLIRALERHRAAHPQNKNPPGILHYLGRAQWSQGRKKEGIENLRLAFQEEHWIELHSRWLLQAALSDDDFNTAFFVANRLHRDSPAKAIDAYVAILKKWPDAAGQPTVRKRVNYNLGHGYYATGQFQKALDQFTLSLEGLPLATPVLEQGWAALHLGRSAEAEAILTKARLRLIAPLNDSARVGLAILRFRDKKYEDAIKMVAPITDSSPHALGRDTLKLHAELALGVKPTSPINAFTLLGVVPEDFSQSSAPSHFIAGSFRVIAGAILPGTPAADAVPAFALRESFASVGSQGVMTNVTSATIPDHPIYLHNYSARPFKRVDLRPIAAKLNVTTDAKSAIQPLFED